MLRRVRIFQWLLFAALSLLLLPRFASPHAFEHDTADDCAEQVQDCASDINIFRQCPISCAKHLEPPSEGARESAGNMNDEDFYTLQATDINGRRIDFENYEGYVTVIAALPKQKAVAQFYYEMLEHLHEVYPFTLEILVVPLEKGVEIEPVENAKVAILPEPHPVLTLLKKGLFGNLASDGNTATLYLVGADGDSVEAFVSTTMPNFQRFLRYHFEKDLKKSEF